MSKGIIFAALAALLLPGAAQAGEENISPPYTVVVMMEYQSPYVADGRSSFADFGITATFRNVRVSYLGDQPLFQMAFQVQGSDGKGVLSRWALNKVETGGKVVEPKVIKVPQQDFAAVLGVTPGPFREEWGKADKSILSPLPLQFRTDWGMDMMKWDYDVGDSYLEEEGLEVFWVDWVDLKDGRPFSITLPYKGAYPEDKGNWLIEFMPQKKK